MHRAKCSFVQAELLNSRTLRLGGGQDLLVLLLDFPAADTRIPVARDQDVRPRTPGQRAHTVVACLRDIVIPGRQSVGDAWSGGGSSKRGHGEVVGVLGSIGGKAGDEFLIDERGRRIPRGCGSGNMPTYSKELYQRRGLFQENCQ